MPKTFATVEFATPTGGIHRQRVACDSRIENASVIIPRAVKLSKKRGVDVANAQRITRGKELIFHYLDTGARFR